MGVSVHWQINRNKKMIGETAVPYKNYLVAPIVKFDEKKEIHGMYSGEHEYIKFTSRIDTAAARG